MKRNSFLEGLKFAFGFSLFFLVIGSVAAIGFHTAEEVLPGTFTTGNYYFNSGQIGIGTTDNTIASHAADDFVVKNTGVGVGITVFSDIDQNGNLFFADGSVGNQEYRGGFQYVHSEDKLRFFSGGQEKILLDGNTGNLGIGVYNPDVNIDIDSNNNPAVIRLLTLNDSSYSAIHMPLTVSTDTNGWWTGVDHSGIGSKYIISKGANTPIGNEKMVIDTNGNIGIGTTTPQRTLEVYGELRINTPSGTLCDDANDYGAIKYVSDNFYGCTTRGWKRLEVD